MLHMHHSNVQAKHDSDLAAASFRFTLICSDLNQFTPPYTSQCVITLGVSKPLSTDIRTGNIPNDTGRS